MNSQYFFAVGELIKGNIKRKFSGNYLWIIWTILSPLAVTGLMSLIFGNFFKADTGCYPVYYLLGHVIVFMFASVIMQCMHSISDDKIMYAGTKVSKSAFVIAGIVTSVIISAFSLLSIPVLMVAYSIVPSAKILLCIPIFILVIALAAGIGALFAVLAVKHKNVKRIAELLLVVVYMASAVFYPARIFTATVNKVNGYNPIFLANDAVRGLVMEGKMPAAKIWAVLAVAAVVSIVLGIIVFNASKKRLVQSILTLSVMLMIMIVPVTSRAATLSAEFGSNWYNKASGTPFDVGAYVKSDVALKEYTFTIEYDKSRLKCISGATTYDEANGLITCTGSGDYLQSVKVWLSFDALSGGEGYIKFVSATATDIDGNVYEITELKEVPIHLTGDDISEEVLANLEANAEPQGDATDNAASDVTENAGTGNSDVDASGENGSGENVSGENTSGDNTTGVNPDGSADGALADGSTGNGTVNDGENAGNKGAQIQSKKEIIYWVIVAAIIIVLVGIVIFATFGNRKKEVASREILDMVDIDDENAGDDLEFVYEDIDAEDEDAEEISVEESNDTAEESSDTAEASSDTAVEDKSTSDNKPAEDKGISDKHSDEQSSDEQSSDEQPSDEQSSDEQPAVEQPKPAAKPRRQPKHDTSPIFKAENVTVRRKVRVVNPTGAGEYISGKINERSSYEQVNVLEKINVTINRGDIVEVIGKDRCDLESFIRLLAGNGNVVEGEVTVKPEYCKVITSKSIFDPELSARANIYRCGALMGYSKNMIKVCYGRIVNFAGAEGMMEENVGNLPETMARKLEIGLALIDDSADIIVLGNVFGECDSDFIRKCRSIIGKIADRDVAVVLFGNIPEIIAVDCNRTIHIENGYIIKR